MTGELAEPATGAPCPGCGAANRLAARFCRQCGGDLPKPDPGTCLKCGASNRSEARFCKKCGAPLALPNPGQPTRSQDQESDPPGRSAPLFAETTALRGARANRDPLDQLKRPIVFVPTVLVALIVMGLIAFFVLRHRAAPAAPVTEFATRLVRVRSATEVAGSSILGDLQRGDTVTGTWVTAADGQTRWLKIRWGSQGDGYVWSRNLSDRPRPILTSFGAGAQVAQAGSLVYPEPDIHTAPLQNLAPGDIATTIGATSDGWTEVALKGGGVGYVRADAFQTPPVPSSAMTPTTDAGTPASSVADGAVASAPAQTVNETSPSPAATRFACAVAPELAKDGIPGAGSLSFSVDESRSCINDRSAYLRTANGFLRRTMLIDKERRAALLLISPDRHVFTRVDYMLTPQAYAAVRQAYPLLVDIACPPPGNDQAAANVQDSLSRANPSFAVPSAAVMSWHRTVWRCAAVSP